MKPRFPRGFTLIELLTVIAIIALLIGLVTPALNNARKNAQRTATRAAITAIASGCEMFKNDNDEYPKSNPASFGDGSATAQANWEVTGLSGANLIVDAMIGRDANGHDPKIGGGAANNTTSRWYNGAVTPPASPRSRNNAYVPPDKIPTTDGRQKLAKDSFGQIDTNTALPQPDSNDARASVFLDKFEYPILYYRANPSATSQTRIIQTVAATAVTVPGDGVFDGRDNMVFTDHNGGGSQVHLINEASTPVTAAEPSGGYNNNFARYILSTRASTIDNSGAITRSRPVNSDTFIMISPGPDGIFGNIDDVANFEVLQDR